MITEEIEHRTIQALLVTPVSVKDLFAAKGITGITLAFGQGALFMALVGGLNEQPAIVILALLLAALLVTGVGFLIASLAKDMMSVLAWGVLALVILVIPAMGVLFPGVITGWAKVIPSYYVIDTVDRVANYASGWPDIWQNLVILRGLRRGLPADRDGGSEEEVPMSVRRVAVLLRRELLQGPKSFIFLWSVVLPIVMSLVLSLVFGTLFSDKPRVGIADEDSSGLVGLAQESQSITLKDTALPAIWSRLSESAPWTSASFCRRTSTTLSRRDSTLRSRRTYGERVWRSTASLPRRHCWIWSESSPAGRLRWISP